MIFSVSDWARRRRHFIKSLGVDPDTQEKLCFHCWGLRNKSWPETKVHYEFWKRRPGICIDFSDDYDPEVDRRREYLCRFCFSLGRSLPKHVEPVGSRWLQRDRDDQYSGLSDRIVSAVFRAFGRCARFIERALEGRLPRISGPLSQASSRFVSLVEAYAETSYVWYSDLGQSILKIGEPSPDLDALLEIEGAESAAFITAWNPDSYSLEGSANDRRNAELLQRIKACGFKHRAGFGAWKEDATKGEASFLVIGIDRQRATGFSQLHGQVSLVFIEKGKPAELIFNKLRGDINDSF